MPDPAVCMPTRNDEAAVLQSVAVDGFDAWREAARRLLAQQVPPHAVQWRGGTAADLFDAALPASSSSPSMPALRIPRELMELLAAAACFRAEDRWGFLYRVIWRWHGGERTVLSAADDDGARLHAMARTVRRESHKMNAFVRFRERAPELGAPRFVAWFEPLHDVLPRVADHFARRMGNASWLIATPDATALWDGRSLCFGPPSASGPLEVDDEGERLWLSYYRSVFNPARLNAQAMEQHMPVRYWKNLPEARLIPGLTSAAAGGARRIAQAAPVGERRGTAVRIAADAAQPTRLSPSALQACRRCELWCNATQVVPGQGPSDARIMVVGEQPGDQEDLCGRPFVGPAGQLLDRALQVAGIARETIYLTNAVKHFKWEPRGKRRMHKTPAQREIAACYDWLEQELESQQPRVVVALGGTALKSLLQTSSVALSDLQGQAFMHQGRTIVPTFHPSYVLRLQDVSQKRAAFAQMVQALRQASALAQAALPATAAIS